MVPPSFRLLLFFLAVEGQPCVSCNRERSRAGREVGPFFSRVRAAPGGESVPPLCSRCRRGERWAGGDALLRVSTEQQQERGPVMAIIFLGPNPPCWLNLGCLSGCAPQLCPRSPSTCQAYPLSNVLCGSRRARGWQQPFSWHGMGCRQPLPFGSVRPACRSRAGDGWPTC